MRGLYSGFHDKTAPVEAKDPLIVAFYFVTFFYKLHFVTMNVENTPTVENQRAGANFVKEKKRLSVIFPHLSKIAGFPRMREHQLFLYIRD